MTFASLFTGGGGADIGAMQAGLTPIWGIEHAPDIADVARKNLGHDVICADVLTVDPRNLPRPDVLHASPPCPNFSTAKAGAEETPLDIALAAKGAEFISALQPSLFTLENVRDYAHSKSLKIIVAALNGCGYAVNSWVLNAADYGVPQTRKRLIVVARRDGVKPQKPQPTHTETPTPLFDHRRQWVGWYEAIADLIPNLPESQLAPWQIARMPAQNTSRDATILDAEQPSSTVICGMGHRPSHMPFVLVDDSGNSNCTTITTRTKEKPSFTVTASRGICRAVVGIRTVAISPRCLARFQSFPDSYMLPDSLSLAVRIVGNAVPPLLYAAVAKSFATASKITPSPAGSWRKAGGVLSKSQGQQQ